LIGLHFHRPPGHKKKTHLQHARLTPLKPTPIPRSPLRLGHNHLVPPIPNHPVAATNLSPRDGSTLWLPAVPHSIASGALVFGSHDGEAAFFSGGRAGAFGELSAVKDVAVAVVAVVVVDVVAIGLGLPAVADAVVGCALGPGNGDDVVAVCGCCGLGALAFFYGRRVLGEFVLGVGGLGDVGLVGDC
jgi:hypothetical protein